MLLADRFVRRFSSIPHARLVASSMLMENEVQQRVVQPPFRLLQNVEVGWELQGNDVPFTDLARAMVWGTPKMVAKDMQQVA